MPNSKDTATTTRTVRKLESTRFANSASGANGFFSRS